MEWILAASKRSLDPKYPTLAKAGGREIALCIVDGAVFAVANTCTHAEARLSDGHLEGYDIVCPLHGGSFDVRTGEVAALPCLEPVEVYPTKIEGENVYVEIVSG
jgi:naphthalene 1,2-dioxygenase system ferredoxin subunit